MLAIIDAVVAVIGLAVAWRLWRPEAERPALEPAFLQRVWYWDDVYDAVIGRPGQAFARFCATVVDGRVIDGAVNGVACAGAPHRQRGPDAPDGLRAQLRAGHRPRLAAVIAFMLSRTWWS